MGNNMIKEEYIDRFGILLEDILNSRVSELLKRNFSEEDCQFCLNFIVKC